MSSIINKIKEKTSSKPNPPPNDTSGEQSFTIQPHPAVSLGCSNDILSGMLMARDIALADF